jgi:large subunit ribosomal protein L22
MATQTTKAGKASGYKAVTKFIIASPFKTRPVADLIRSKPYTEAMAMLQVMPHKGARLLSKTLKSAASNALSQNKQLVEDSLYVKEIRIDEGPRMKRIWCRARGRADMMLKRICHITVVVDELAAKASNNEKAGK